MATDIWQITDTYTLLATVQRIEEPLDYITKTFFGETMTVNTSYVAVETRSEGRLLAPQIVQGSRGVDVNRTGSKVHYYSPILFGPRRVISLQNVTSRLFGDVPNLYAPISMEQQAARIQSEDMADLLRLHANRKEKMAAELLQTGKLTLKAFADDGQVPQTDVLDFGWKGKIIPTKYWNDPDAKIYDDLYAVSEEIQYKCGQVPTFAICGRGVERDLLANKEIHDWLMVPSPTNLSMAQFAPQWTSPEVRYIGRISALNLDLISYVRTYQDEDGTTKPYVDDNAVIVATGNIGKIIYAPVQIFEDGRWQSISAPAVPKYSVSDESMTTSLTLYSKYVIVPMSTDYWSVIRTHGES